MEELPRHRARKALLFLLVCTMHGLIGWFLLAKSRVMTLTSRAVGFELLVLEPQQITLPTSTTARPSAVPPKVYRPTRRRIVSNEKTAESGTNEITTPIDWNAELVRSARATVSNDANIPVRNFGFPTRSTTIEDYPQFDWDYARTHRVESIPEGGVIIHLNDNCVLVMNPFPFPLCSPIKQKANGELFKHLRDPNKPGDSSIP